MIAQLIQLLATMMEGIEDDAMKTVGCYQDDDTTRALSHSPATTKETVCSRNDTDKEEKDEDDLVPVPAPVPAVTTHVPPGPVQPCPIAVPPLRMLCLHDGNSNAKEVSSALQVLDEKLYEKYAVEFVYVNSPLVTTRADEATAERRRGTREEAGGGEDRRPRIWWSEEAAAEAEESSCPVSSSQQQKQQQEQQQQKSRNDDNGDDDVTTDDVDWDDLDTNNEEGGRERSSLLLSSSKKKNILKQYSGLDGTLFMLHQIWTKSSSFWGVLGIGQGAGMAALLTLMLTNTTNTTHTAVPPAFCIFINGTSVLPHPEHNDEQLISDVPCLHIINKQSSSSRNGNSGSDSGSCCSSALSSPSTIMQQQQEQQQQQQQQQQQEEAEILAHQFGGTIQYYYTKNHTNTTSNSNNSSTSSSSFVTKETMNAIGRFVIQQKKKRTRTLNGHQVVNRAQQEQQIAVLRTLLHKTQHEAALWVANTIAQNPPPSLQAVILPGGTVGGYNHATPANSNNPTNNFQKPNPAVGTRGAPCPTRFRYTHTERQRQQQQQQQQPQVGPQRPQSSQRTTNNKEWRTYCLCTIEKPLLQQHIAELKQQRLLQQLQDETNDDGGSSSTSETNRQISMLGRSIGNGNTTINSSSSEKWKTSMKKSFDLFDKQSLGCCRLAVSSTSTPSPPPL